MSIIPKGKEPANVKKRIDTLFPKLDSAYPDKVIISLQKDHHKWDETAREISKQLGYECKNDFLEAYGYKIQQAKNGRTANDNMAIIEELKKRYPNGSPFQKLPDLAAANSDLAPKFKAMQNKANELFGMTFVKYLVSEGILVKPQKEQKTVISAEERAERHAKEYTTQVERESKKSYLLVGVELYESKATMNYLSTLESISIGDFVEALNDDNQLEYARVTSVESIQNDELNEYQDLRYLERKVELHEFKEWFFKWKYSYTETIKIQSLFSEKLRNIPSELELLDVPYAIIRGPREEITSVFQKLSEMESRFGTKVYLKEDITMLSDNLAELFVFCNDVQFVIKNYPKVKVAMFIDNTTENSIYFAYSKYNENVISVYEKITSGTHLEAARWNLINLPVEDFFISNQNIQYVFSMANDWNNNNYEVHLDD